MQTIPISDLVVGERQRKEIGPKKLEELKRGILSKGLLHPVTVSEDDSGQIHLRAGERRLRAIEALHAEGHEIKHNGELVPENAIPYIFVRDLSPEDLFELELEENLLREPLTWMEEIAAVKALHDLRKAQNPKHTVRATAEEISERLGTSQKTEEDRVARANIIMQHKDKPYVKRAKNEMEAIKAILDESESTYKAKMAVRTQKIASPHKIIHGDCRDILPTLPSGSINTIICDPPYGIEADKAGQESKHYYKDDAAYALEICEFIFREGWRLAGKRAILFMFHDITHFPRLAEFGSQMAWTVHRTPLIWFKEQGGRAPWGKAGFQRSYESILLAVKGQDELLYPGGMDVLSYKQTANKDRDHAANKPVELLSRLVQLSTLPGETILDPCAGSGTLIPAADKHNVRTILCETDEASYSKCLNRLNPTAPSTPHGDSEQEEPTPSNEELFT